MIVDGILLNIYNLLNTFYSKKEYAFYAKRTERCLKKKAWRICRKEVVMKAKRWLAGCMAALGVLAVGCSSSVEMEEEIIIMKNEDGGDGEGGMSAGAGSGQGGTSEFGNLGEIAEQVQAPERYTADFSVGNITVKVETPVVIPAGEGFKTYRVKGRPFDQEDYDRVSHILLKDGGLWTRDLEAMSASNGMTRGEIEKTIAQMEAEQAELEALGAEYYVPKAGKGFEEELENLEHMMENALEEPAIVEVPAVVTVNTGGEQGSDKEAGWLSGYATVDGEEYWVSIDNMFTQDWCWCTFRILKKVEELGYYPEYYSFSGLSDEQKENAGFSIDEIRSKAEETVAAMGFTDFVPSGEEYYAVYADVQDYDTIQEAVQKIGYGIHFTRKLEGVPETYTADSGMTMPDDGENLVWPYEKLTLVYSEDGLVNFVWGNPYEVEKVSDEYLFLLPFAEIQNIFEEMIIKKYQDWMKDNDDMKMDFQIGEVRLGYMRVREKGKAQEAAMIPVWDFIGTRKVTYDGEESFYDENSVFESALTINALDGTIIDRESGY